MEYAIETFSLTKVFSDWWGRDKVCAVSNLDLQVRYNEVFGLLGPNGSGKTTTLKVLLGLLYPTKGRAIVLGGDSTNPKISARIGFLPEESYLYRYLTARETLDFYGRLFGLPRKVRTMRTEALLDMVGLKAVANRPVGTFSKGMARRIGLAQALINDPELLILDEPTTGLDPIGTRQIKDLVLELARRGKTILLCSHLLADVEDVCDKIAILYGGRIQSEGKVRDLLEQTGKRQITTGPLSDTALARIRDIAEGENSDCVITAPLDKLETFFIRTVTAAQLQARPTSGAVSTTKISDFLAAQKTPEDLLYKLVSSPVTSDAAPSQMPTMPVEKAEREQDGTGPQGRPDTQLLRKLSEQTEPVESKPVETEPVKPRQTQEQQIQQNILDMLTDRQVGRKRQENEHDSSEGDETDA